jgi:hypothetical protein
MAKQICRNYPTYELGVFWESKCANTQEAQDWAKIRGLLFWIIFFIVLAIDFS